MGISNKNSELEYMDLVDTLKRLDYLCKKLNMSSILKGNVEQIEIISEIKNRISDLEVERVEPLDFDYKKYEA